MEAVSKQLDAVVDGVCKQHDPVGCLPFVLGVATAAIVAAVTASSVRWYFVVLSSIGGAALTWIGLMAFRVSSWARHHPLLFEMFKLNHRGDDDADFGRVELGLAIVRHYLPPGEGEPLLVQVDVAKERAVRLLGSDLDAR
jgi:hypothetical protein